MTTRSQIILIALMGLYLTACAPKQTWSSTAIKQSWKPGDKIVDPQPTDMEAAAAQRSTATGKIAPPFILLDEVGNQVELAKLRGQWVVLYFYPKDDTPGCVCQATEFTGLLTHFREMKTKVIGVSPDTVKNHQFFREKYSLGITLLSDVEHQVMQRYGAWVRVRLGDQVTGRVIRSTFIIDPAGRIAWHWPEVIPSGHAQRVQQKLAELSGYSS